MNKDSQQSKIIKEICDKNDLLEDQVLEIINLPFEFIRKEIKEIELTGNENSEEFTKKTKNFNIPSIGKLYANYYNFINLQKAKQHVRRKQKCN